MKQELKYLKNLPWLDIVGTRYVEEFEKANDLYLPKLVPFYKVAKKLDVELFDFGHDEPEGGYASEYYVEPSIFNGDCFTINGVTYLMKYKDGLDCGEKRLYIIRYKDRYPLSWHDCLYAHLTNDMYRNIGASLLFPYQDAYISTFPAYSAFMNNINTEFRKLTGDDDVELIFDGSTCLMALSRTYEKEWLHGLK